MHAKEVAMVFLILMPLRTECTLGCECSLFERTQMLSFLFWIWGFLGQVHAQFLIVNSALQYKIIVSAQLVLWMPCLPKKTLWGSPCVECYCCICQWLCFEGLRMTSSLPWRLQAKFIFADCFGVIIRMTIIWAVRDGVSHILAQFGAGCCWSSGAWVRDLSGYLYWVIILLWWGWNILSS